MDLYTLLGEKSISSERKREHTFMHNRAQVQKLGICDANSAAATHSLARTGNMLPSEDRHLKHVLGD
jgi:hypothetical protein